MKVQLSPIFQFSSESSYGTNVYVVQQEEFFTCEKRDCMWTLVLCLSFGGQVTPTGLTLEQLSLRRVAQLWSRLCSNLAIYRSPMPCRVKRWVFVGHGKWCGSMYAAFSCRREKKWADLHENTLAVKVGVCLGLFLHKATLKFIPACCKFNGLLHVKWF